MAMNGMMTMAIVNGVVMAMRCYGLTSGPGNSVISVNGSSSIHSERNLIIVAVTVTLVMAIYNNGFQ